MAARIEDYGLLSNMYTGPLVSRDGSVDWLCFPRFDSPSVFGSLLGTSEHGRWLLAPVHAAARVVNRQYVQSTFVLNTTWQTPSGDVMVTDFMPVGDGISSLVRRITGLSGRVAIRQDLKIKMQYASVRPWTSRIRTLEEEPEILLAMAGPEALALRTRHLPLAQGNGHEGEFVVVAGETADFELTWFPSHKPVPPALDIDYALQETTGFWSRWASNYRREEPYADEVQRSLLVLRALTHAETGGIVAAPTTSLPEEFGGTRNWDYRFCWLRDAALTLESMLVHGYETEALTWRNWLLRALAGDPEGWQIMYGIGGERNLPEMELTGLPGYENSRPVRVGNGAVNQYQADVVGEVMVAFERLRLAGGREDHFSWPLQRALLEYVEGHYWEKDCGLWEMRGETRYFTHSRAMMWAAFDAGIRAVSVHGYSGPLEKWQALREKLKSEVLARGFDQQLNSFTQTYGGQQTDASLLVLPQIGLLSYDDPRMLGTVERLEKELLTEGGLLLRYRTDTGVDGLAPGEHPFLACSFWLVEQYARTGREADASQLMARLLGLCNELGLLSEEYAEGQKRMAGNFPQAFSHLALVRAADALRGGDSLNFPVL